MSQAQTIDRLSGVPPQKWRCRWRLWVGVPLFLFVLWLTGLRRGLAILLLVTVTSVCLGEPQHSPEVRTYRVAMRDGVKLATDVYLPGDGKGKYPVIVARTPYDKSKGGRALAANAARRGYALVVQDLRGRFQSEGHPAIIFGNDGLGEHQDGPDTLEWIARQPWCNGTIGSWGGSADRPEGPG